MISLESFARLVQSMRKCQRKGDKYASNWEAHVDAALQEILAPPQLSLFDSPNHEEDRPGSLAADPPGEPL